jgi:hypothetical protein
MLIWKRRIAWWNEDSTSLELSEKYHIHCAEFGKGIDFATQVFLLLYNII